MKTPIDAEWLAHHVPAMRRLKKPSQPQSVILELAENPEPTPKDRKRLIAAITAERAAIKATQAQNRLGAILARENTANRKMETRRKFILGDLALAEARRNPEFLQRLLPIIKTNITELRDLAALAPLIADQLVPSGTGDQPAPASPPPAPKRARRPALGKAATADHNLESSS